MRFSAPLMDADAGTGRAADPGGVAPLTPDRSPLFHGDRAAFKSIGNQLHFLTIR
ncbi:MAG: hypothetical protein ACKON9_20620 [Planctomycetaceae bacterium]